MVASAWAMGEKGAQVRHVVVMWMRLRHRNFGSNCTMCCCTWMEVKGFAKKKKKWSVTAHSYDMRTLDILLSFTAVHVLLFFKHAYMCCWSNGQGVDFFIWCLLREVIALLYPFNFHFIQKRELGHGSSIRDSVIKQSSLLLVALQFTHTLRSPSCTTCPSRQDLLSRHTEKSQAVHGTSRLDPHMLLSSYQPCWPWWDPLGKLGLKNLGFRRRF